MSKCHLNILGLLEVLQTVKCKLFPRKSRDTSLDYELQGKVCICTGANAGIGLATVEELLTRGVHAVLACRSQLRAKAAAEYLKSLQPVPGFQLGTVKIAEVDLASLQSVKDFVAGFGGHVDYLICNAGVMAPPKRTETIDGLELQFQTNFLGHWLLSLLLLDKQLQKAQQRADRPMRIVMLSSLTHFGGKLNFDDLQAEKKYSPFGQYAATKLATLITAKELNRRLDALGSKDLAVAVHPGIVDTMLARQYFLQEIPGPLRSALKPLLDHMVFPMFLKSPQQAADDILYACTAAADEVRGKYIADGAVSSCSSLADDEHMAKQLWRAAGKLIKVPADTLLLSADTKDK